MSTKPKRNRRPLVAREQWKPALLIPTVAGSSATTITLEFSPQTLGVQPIQVLQGIPAVKRVSDNALPTAATIVGDGMQLELTYTGTMTGTVSLLYPAWDPAVRTPVGGYVAPALLTETI